MKIKIFSELCITYLDRGQWIGQEVDNIERGVRDQDLERT